MGASDAVPTSTVVLSVDQVLVASATLRELVDTLGPHAVRVVSAVDGPLDRPVGEPVVHGVTEPVDQAGDLAGALVLLTGSRADQPDTRDAVRRLGEAGAGAVVVKAWGTDLTRVAEAADEAGVALLSTPDEMAWRHLDALVTASRAAAARVGDDAAPHRPGDLFALANAIAASLGGAVTLEEPSGRVIAYSNLPGQEIDEIRRRAILGRQTPDRPSNAREYRSVIQAGGPVFFTSTRTDYASRMAVAVRAGHQVLGLIFVLADRPPLVENAEAVLSDAARAAALHLLRARGDHDPDRVRRSHALRGLVTGELDGAAAAPLIGTPPGSELVLAVVRPSSPLGPRELEAARMTDLVALHGEYWNSATVSTVVSDQILLLLPVEATEGDTGDRRARLGVRLRKLGAGVVSAVDRSMGIDVRVGFAPPVGELDQLPHSLRYAELVLQVLEQDRHANPAVATLDDVRNDVVIASLGEESVVVDEALVLPQVRAVLDHDAAQGTEYAQTLLTHLGTFGDVALTARQLDVHDNTARYRVRRLEEVFGIELAGGDEVLVTWLQLRALTRLRR